MTLKAIYLNVVSKSDIPLGKAHYTFLNEDGHIVFGEGVLLELKNDDVTIKDSIERMKKIEQQDGFMFWNNSLEGEIFFEKNRDTLSESLWRNHLT